MQRRIPVVVGVVLVIAAALYLWRCHGSGSSSSTPASSTSASANAGVTGGSARKPRPDPKTVVRGTLSGTVTDEATQAPVGGARVCASGRSNELSEDLLRDPVCVASDARGAYVIGNLLPATYVVSASAKPYRPGLHHPGGDRERRDVRLAAGEQKPAIDIALRAGGVRVTGTVSDLTGGPIAHARVSSTEGWGDRRRALASTESDAAGAFELWVDPGHVQIAASADGYADNSESLRAPGKVEILLTPSSSLAGIVVDARTNEPVAGARVRVSTAGWSFRDDDSVFTDAAGAFRVERLAPGRYVAVARTEHGYGRTDGSTLVGLGQHVDGVVVKLWPAYRVAGKVVVSATKQPCEDSTLLLRNARSDGWLETRRTDDGTLYADGVLPGTYNVIASCDGYQARDRYDPIVITDKDAVGLVWEVDAGATVKGRVLTKTGEPVEGAEIWARTVGGAARDRTGWGGARSERDGSYKLTGLKPGSYKIELGSERGIQPKDGVKVDVSPGATLERDLVLEDGGTLSGVVVDADGKPVAGIEVSAMPLTDRWEGGEEKTDDSGAFTMHPIRAGEYRVVARRNWSDQLRKPGTTDDAKQGERATVKLGQTSTVRLVVESQSGTIKGSVLDAQGKPVPDAFVSAARESDAAGAAGGSAQQTRWWDERPVLTGLDGAFTLTKLSPGKYTVRAYRKGGGEAIAEHVALGSTARLQIRATGSITGTARLAGGGAPDELSVTVRDQTTGLWRDEDFYRTGGAFVVRDLPKGHFQITVQTTGGMKTTELDLAEGEQRTGVDIELDAMVSISGRVVDLVSRQPVPGIRMFAQTATGGGYSISFANDGDNQDISDEAGRFTVDNVPRGKILVRGWPKDWGEGDYGMFQAMRTIDANATGTVDIGDLEVIRKRIQKDQAVGELGVRFAEQPPDTPPDKRERKVSFIDPQGPAAKTELKVGDVVTSVDGIEVAGEDFGRWSALVRAPPGTKLVLGLARGASVPIVLAAP